MIAIRRHRDEVQWIESIERIESTENLRIVESFVRTSPSRLLLFSSIVSSPPAWNKPCMNRPEPRIASFKEEFSPWIER